MRVGSALAQREAVFVYSPEFETFSYPEDNPFKTDRAGQLRKVLNSMGLLYGAGRREMPPVPADRKALKKFHSARYLYALKTAAEGKWDNEALNMGIGSVDCPVFAGMYDYAALATGATVVGADLIMSGSANIVFNPSGGFHHAGPERAAGFCYMNDVAIACTILAEQRKRVLYLDVDVHHGDGVAYAFYERSDVMTISLHEDPRVLFPGTGFEDEIGSGKGLGYCVNVPLPVGTYDEAYMRAFDAVAIPLIFAFNPDVIVFELGVDALAGDPLAHLCLTNNTYAAIIKHLMSFDKPILATGGGGYNVENTVRAWALAWAVFCGEDTDPGMDSTVGGVMLASTDWRGGLRDRELPVTKHQREVVLPAVERVIESVKARVFPIHGL